MAMLSSKLQQHLPLAVLKQYSLAKEAGFIYVATAPTACGIETLRLRRFDSPPSMVATAPTACGIETLP